MCWQMPIMNVVAHCYYLEAKVVNYLLLSDLSWCRVFMRAGFVFRYLSIYPAMNIIYLPLPNCSGNFNRYALQDTTLQALTLSTITAFNAFELRFIVRVLLHHRLRFYPLPQSRYNP